MIRFMAMPQQKLWRIDGDPNRPAENETGAGLHASGDFRFVTCDGPHEVRRALLRGDDDYIVYSARTSIIWDAPLIERVRTEIADVNALGVGWLCLVAEGATAEGQQLAAAFFDREPSLTPDRGRRCVVQSAGSLYVFNVANLRRLTLAPLPNSDFVPLANQLIVLGYANGLSTLHTDKLYPCFADRRNLDYLSLEELVARIDPVEFAAGRQVGIDRLSTVQRCELLREWVDDAVRALTPKHTLSFVVRTIFKRPFLLRRCLISIDYLRRSLDLPAEVVIATDIADAPATEAIAELSAEFPGLVFVRADGNGEEGFSRVRNLIAGIKATTGSRVAIIDDDDFYMPAAVTPFSLACRGDSLVVFDTQIVNEKWDASGIKMQRELMSYGSRFEAKGWTWTIRGSNSVPLCGAIHPGDFARAVIGEYRFRHDYSEDFIFHLMAFTHRLRPPIVTDDTLGAFQSHRVGDDNVSNVEDRTPWVADVGNGIHQLLIERGYTFEVVSNAEALEGAIVGREDMEWLKAELERTRAALRETTTFLAKTTVQLRGLQKQQFAALSKPEHSTLNVRGPK